LLSRAGKGLSLSIYGDNAFYSQKEHLKRGRRLEELPPFQQLSCSIANVNKTGLGSSAALVTSLCSSLLQHFGIVDLRSPSSSRELLHQLAQYCHCLAQNSIGSGFDVSAAVFGPQIYERFTPDILHLPPLDQGRKGKSPLRHNSLSLSLSLSTSFMPDDNVQESTILPKLRPFWSGGGMPGMAGSSSRADFTSSSVISAKAARRPVW
jgi:ERG8-type phosphomevalonate kinase